MIGRASRSIGVPWRPSDTRAALRHIIEAAYESGDLNVAVEPIVDDLEAAIAWHHQEAARCPGNAANAARWALRAESMRERLAHITEFGLHGRRPSVATETFTVTGSDPVRLSEAIEAIVSDLRRSGFSVERQVECERPPSETTSECSHARERPA